MMETKKEFSLSDLSELEAESTIDRIDAKTLNLCVESITTLLNEDVQGFMRLPLQQRIAIFRQMSQLLDVSFRLFPLLEQRELKPFHRLPTAVGGAGNELDH